MIQFPVVHEDKLPGMQFFGKNRSLAWVFVKMGFRTEQVLPADAEYPDIIESVLVNSLRCRLPNLIGRGNNADLVDTDFGCLGSILEKSTNRETSD